MWMQPNLRFSGEGKGLDVPDMSIAQWALFVAIASAILGLLGFLAQRREYRSSGSMVKIRVARVYSDRAEPNRPLPQWLGEYLEIRVQNSGRTPVSVTNWGVIGEMNKHYQGWKLRAPGWRPPELPARLEAGAEIKLYMPIDVDGYGGVRHLVQSSDKSSGLSVRAYVDLAKGKMARSHKVAIS